MSEAEPPRTAEADDEQRYAVFYGDIGDPLTPEEIAALTPEDIEDVPPGEIIDLGEGRFLRAQAFPVRLVTMNDPETGESRHITAPLDPAMSDEDARRSAADFLTLSRRAERMLTDEEITDYAARLEREQIFRAMADELLGAIRETIRVTVTESDENPDLDIPPEHHATAAKEATKLLHQIAGEAIEGILTDPADNGFPRGFARDVLHTAWTWAFEDAAAGIEGLREAGQLTPEAATPEALDELAATLYEHGTYDVRALLTLHHSALAGLARTIAGTIEGLQREGDPLKKIVSHAWKQYTASLPPPVMMPGFHSGWGTVPSSHAARSAILAIQGGADGKWQINPSNGFPWFAAPELSFLTSPDDYQTPDAAWDAVRALDDETVDAFMIACAQYIANRTHTRDGLVLITPDDILAQRGIAKHKRAYKPEDREKAAGDFMRLGTIAVEGHRDGFETTGRKGKGKSKRIRVTLEGKLIEISVRARQQALSDDLAPVPGSGKTAGFWYRLGPWAQGFLGSDGAPQLAAMNQTILRYHAKNQRHQKRIGYYLVWQFRIQRGAQSFQVRTLLEQSGISLTTGDYKNPGRFREAIERALEGLKRDGIIGSLEWVSTPALPEKRWLDEWLCWTIHITPPAALLEQYQTIGKPRLQVLPGKRDSA